MMSKFVKTAMMVLRARIVIKARMNTGSIRYNEKRLNNCGKKLCCQWFPDPPAKINPVPFIPNKEKTIRDNNKPFRQVLFTIMSYHIFI